ncbi:unnamed protein product [Spirodela intermedia]|uniref:Auxin efflux carrier component n=1 Tax=Spirodela intermedia TaxID=51605 RepID=A0A7I8IS37_SPIIN|nr:unnamed protein product [Spirodela intermedia]CAA6660347.1 unnamed protein product [Spirodela intermedia]
MAQSSGGVFSPEQCSGINRFVAVFAVPVLSFYFISQNNPYQMDLKFVLADTLSKVAVLVVLSLWPYTLLLFLFEYRSATLLIRNNFPGPAAAAISRVDVDGDVISLDGGTLSGRNRSSTSMVKSGSSAISSVAMTPRHSSLSGAEIYSANTPGRPGAAAPSYDYGSGDGAAMGCKMMSPRLSGYASSEVYSFHPTPRASNFNEVDASTPVWAKSPATAARTFRSYSPAVNSAARAVWEFQQPAGQRCKDLGGNERFLVQSIFHPSSDLSFRSTSKFVLREEDEPEDPEEGIRQKMPPAGVMVRLILIMVVRKLLRNPNTYSSVLGLVWSLISFRWGVGMPVLLKNSINIIADAGLGMAMFSLGLFMALQPRIIACGPKMAVLSMAIRFISGPMIVSAASFAVELRGARLRTAIVQAALPQGIVPFVFAREYGLHPDILSTGVIFGMLVSLPTTLLYYVLLGL